MLAGIPQVTKNLLLLNVLMFILTFVFQMKGVDLKTELSAFPFGTAFFKPYQSISHMFMHGNITHIFMNMFGLVTFGGTLEKLWGAKRFFIFYMICGIGAYLVGQIIDVIELQNITSSLISKGANIDEIKHVFREGKVLISSDLDYLAYQNISFSSSLGASAAIYGLLFSFAILFPNTELSIMFLPFPFKAKYLVGAFFVIETILIFNKIEGDNIDHLGHVSGGVIGAIIVLIWRKRSNHFY